MPAIEMSAQVQTAGEGRTMIPKVSLLVFSWCQLSSLFKPAVDANVKVVRHHCHTWASDAPSSVAGASRTTNERRRSFQKEQQHWHFCFVVLGYTSTYAIQNVRHLQYYGLRVTGLTALLVTAVTVCMSATEQRAKCSTFYSKFMLML